MGLRRHDGCGFWRRALLQDGGCWWLCGRGCDQSQGAQVPTGGARGADRLGFRWAWQHTVPSQCFRAEWERFGKAAGVRRNHQMAQAGDVLVAFWDGQSPGTAHLIQCMRALGKPVVLVSSDTPT